MNATQITKQMSNTDPTEDMLKEFMLENKLGKKNWLSGKKHIDLWWLLDYLIISLTTIRPPPDSSHMKSEDYNLHFFLS